MLNTAVPASKVVLALALCCAMSGAGWGEPMRQKTIKIYNAGTGQVEEVEPVVKSDEEWRKLLTPEQYAVTRQKGTERAFSRQCAIPASGQGTYQCVCCGTDLFSYGKKFDSGTGWPSFFDPVSPLNIILRDDHNFGMHRVEVLCARCAAHLGHVFDDGPPPTGKRHCINAVALKLSPRDVPAPSH